MYKYKIKSAKGWWKANGLGYTQNEQEAGIFTGEELANHHLDGCTLYRVWNNSQKLPQRPPKQYGGFFFLL